MVEGGLPADTDLNSRLFTGYAGGAEHPDEPGHARPQQLAGQRGRHPGQAPEQPAAAVAPSSHPPLCKQLVWKRCLQWLVLTRWATRYACFLCRLGCQRCIRPVCPFTVFTCLHVQVDSTLGLRTRAGCLRIGCPSTSRPPTPPTGPRATLCRPTTSLATTETVSCQPPTWSLLVGAPSDISRLPCTPVACLCTT